MNAAFSGGHVLASVLFIVFGAAIFAGAVLHVGKLVLGPAGPALPPAERRWQDAAVLALGLVLVGIAFWLPRPLVDLIRGAARVIGGE